MGYVAAIVASSFIGITLGGFALAYGVRYANLPFNKIGGVLLVLIAAKMFFG